MKKRGSSFSNILKDFEQLQEKKSQTNSEVKKRSETLPPLKITVKKHVIQMDETIDAIRKKIEDEKKDLARLKKSYAKSQYALYESKQKLNKAEQVLNESLIKDKKLEEQVITVKQAIELIKNDIKKIENQMFAIIHPKLDIQAQWFEAAEKNNAMKLKTGPISLVNINALNKQGLTALQCAASLGNVEAMQVLLDKKANINFKDAQGFTALHYAVVCNHPEAVSLLIKAGADTSITTEDGDRVH